ncbi:MAG: hypothetical protein ACRDPY_00980 [Streptosporangiaceae bacterium]
MTEHWSSARERELTKFYNAKLRARRTDSAHARHCRITITQNWHLSPVPDSAPRAALAGNGPITSELAHPAGPAQVLSLERQASDGHP